DGVGVFSSRGVAGRSLHQTRLTGKQSRGRASGTTGSALLCCGVGDGDGRDHQRVSGDCWLSREPEEVRAASGWCGHCS
ncbi:MAG: hypothetical protein ACREP9_06035, partial [Candidatus Dormibacteraceae bacterium]